MRWLIVGSLLISQPAWGWFLDGATLLRVCTSGDRADAAGCEGYIIGVFDSVDTAEGSVCLPERRPASQVVDVVIDYLGRNPEQHHQAAASLVRYALVTAFPCS